MQRHILYVCNTCVSSPAVFIWKPHAVASQMRIIDLSVRTSSLGAAAPGEAEMDQEHKVPPGA